MNDISRHLVAQVRDAREGQDPLQITGRGSKTFYGRAGRGTPIALANHCGIVNYEPGELVITARAGTALTDIEATLAQHGQMLAFDPPRFGDEGSLGGTLACNLSGPGRPWTGSVADMVLGLELINGLGEQLHFGGQVMKNVAGYDVSRLQAGAMGCLGIITQVSLKVVPKPAQSISVECPIETSVEAIAVMNGYSAGTTPITGACWHNGRLCLRFEGAAKAVEHAATQFCSSVPAAKALEDSLGFWSSLRDHKLSFFQGDTPLWRISCKSTLNLETDAQHCLLDWGGAQRWLRSELPQAQLASGIATGSGQISLFRHGYRDDEVFHPQPEEMAQLHKRLKTAFDPAGLFNPGRLYSWL